MSVARVVINSSVPHIDRLFDYRIPDALKSTAVAGVRVKVPFAGGEADGFIAKVDPDTNFPGAIKDIRRVVGTIPVLAPQVYNLAVAVAARYVGTAADVLSLAVAPRQARVEKEVAATLADAAARELMPSAAAQGSTEGRDDPWQQYPAGPALRHRISLGQPIRAIWQANPGAEHWMSALAQLAATTARTGGGALVLVPTSAAARMVTAAVRELLPADQVTQLTADLGPTARYRSFLACRSGQARVVVGTRAAAYAPVADLRLIAMWDDGNDLYLEPRAPYAPTRAVACLRADLEQTALVIGGWTCTVDSAADLQTGRTHLVRSDLHDRRHRWANVLVSDQTYADDIPARVPRIAWQHVKAALATGPVLVQVPRAGYIPSLLCQSCRQRASCPHCTGPLSRVDSDLASGIECRWCARSSGGWRCAHCGDQQLRAAAVGVQRTAAEFGQAFPGVPVIVSQVDAERPRVPDAPALVLSTSGLEPVAPGGYAAALLLDGDALLGRADLWAADEALRRWLAAAALVRSAADGGRVVLCANGEHPAVQAVVRADPVAYARGQLTDRVEAGLPPAVLLATLDGSCSALTQLVSTTLWGEGMQVIGPAPMRQLRSGPAPGVGRARRRASASDELAVVVPPSVVAPCRAIVRCDRGRAGELAPLLRQQQQMRSAAHQPAIRINLSPRDIG